MAKKSSTTSGKYSDLEFINHEFAPNEVRQLESLDLEVEFPLSVVFELVSEGYKFTSAYDERNNCFRASLIDQRPDGQRHVCLSGRGSTAADAWYALAFRHFVLSQEDWSFFRAPDVKSGGRFG